MDMNKPTDTQIVNWLNRRDAAVENYDYESYRLYWNAGDLRRRVIREMREEKENRIDAAIAKRKVARRKAKKIKQKLAKKSSN